MQFVPFRKNLALLTLLVLFLQACTSIPVEQRAEKRAQLDQQAAESIELFLQENPAIEGQMENSAGYFVATISSATVAIVGGAQGIGVLFDQSTGARSYLNVNRFDVGAGLGVRSFRLLLIIDDPEKLAEIRSGLTLKGLSADLAAGSRSATQQYQLSDGVTVHVLSKTGAEIAATARRVRLTVNEDLTDTGLSEISIPNRGFNIEDGFEETDTRVWDRKMPFMAQKVIDMGYDLPLPYGFKVGYVNVDQEQILTNLFVGFNGSKPIPLDWVEFTNARSINDTAQLIFDTWVFPFMNVYGVVGKIDGNAPVDVLIEGNGFLEELGIDCSKPGNFAACAILQDNLFLLPINAKFSGNNYGIGINLAGGWKGFFVTVPMTWSYADMDGSNTDGAVFSASPRIGKVFNLGSRGNLALYAGGSYLKSDLTVDGSYQVPFIEEEFTIDYIIDQENKDPWNLVLGLNWDITKRWSVQAEYNGFIGSRETWVGTVSWRF